MKITGKLAAFLAVCAMGLLGFCLTYLLMDESSLQANQRPGPPRQKKGDTDGDPKPESSPLVSPESSPDKASISRILAPEKPEARNHDVTDGASVGNSPRLLNLSALPPDLYQYGKSVFDHLPDSYLPGYKSSCWKVSGRLRCLPYFYLAGMPKSGTTDLWDKMVKHPDIKWTEKEPHWWARHRLNLTYRTKMDARFNGKPLGQYVDNRCVVLNRELRSNPARRASLIVGDGSASTFWDNSRWQDWTGYRYEGPKYVTADVIHAVQPNARQIVIFRNPVDRVYSGYIYFNGKSVSPQRFHDEVVKSIDRFNKCLESLSFRACAYSTYLVQSQTSWARILLGLYYVYLEDWLRVFPRDQIKVYRLEDWHSNCTGILEDVFNFLGLSQRPKEEISGYCKTKASNANKAKSSRVGDMLPATRKLLQDFYSEPNKRLSQILGDDAYLWHS